MKNESQREEEEWRLKSPRKRFVLIFSLFYFTSLDTGTGESGAK